MGPAASACRIPPLPIGLHACSFTRELAAPYTMGNTSLCIETVHQRVASIHHALLCMYIRMRVLESVRFQLFYQTCEAELEPVFSILMFWQHDGPCLAFIFNWNWPLEASGFSLLEPGTVFKYPPLALCRFQILNARPFESKGWSAYDTRALTAWKNPYHLSDRIYNRTPGAYTRIKSVNSVTKAIVFAFLGHIVPYEHLFYW